MWEVTRVVQSDSAMLISEQSVFTPRTCAKKCISIFLLEPGKLHRLLIEGREEECIRCTRADLLTGRAQGSERESAGFAADPPHGIRSAARAMFDERQSVEMECGSPATFVPAAKTSGSPSRVIDAAARASGIASSFAVISGPMPVGSAGEQALRSGVQGDLRREEFLDNGMRRT